MQKPRELEAWERYVMAYPSRDEGPPKRTWLPAVPACLDGHRPDGVGPVWFSVVAEDGEVHRFLLSRQGAVEVAAGLARAVSPGWVRGLIRGWATWHHRRLFQSFSASGRLKREGSPQLGQDE